MEAKCFETRARSHECYIVLLFFVVRSKRPIRHQTHRRLPRSYLPPCPSLQQFQHNLVDTVSLLMDARLVRVCSWSGFLQREYRPLSHFSFFVLSQCPCFAPPPQAVPLGLLQVSPMLVLLPTPSLLGVVPLLLPLQVVSVHSLVSLEPTCPAGFLMDCVTAFILPITPVFPRKAL